MAFDVNDDTFVLNDVFKNLYNHMHFAFKSPSRSLRGHDSLQMSFEVISGLRFETSSLDYP